MGVFRKNAEKYTVDDIEKKSNSYVLTLLSRLKEDMNKSISELEEALGEVYEKNEVYTKAETDEKLAVKADLKNVDALKNEVQARIDEESDSISDRLDSLSGSIDYIGEKQAVHDNEYTALKKSTEADIEALKTDTASLKTGVDDINEQISSIEGQLNTYGTVLTNLENGKAGKDLSNVENSVFLEKINAVLADGDEVSY